MPGLSFGLNVKKKTAKQKPAVKLQTSSVFKANEADEEIEEGFDADKRRANRELASISSSSVKKGEELTNQALKEDVSIFDYDAALETKQEKRKAEKEEKYEMAKVAASSQYVTNLMGVAEQREREKSRIHDRKLLKERQKDDDLYGNKEKFVTSAYKAKLAADKAFDEEEKRKEEAEQAQSVSSKGMTGFYSGLLNTKNVAMGGKAALTPAVVPASTVAKGNRRIQPQGGSDEDQQRPHVHSAVSVPVHDSARTPATNPNALVAETLQKIEAARRRYIERKKKRETM